MLVLLRLPWGGTAIGVVWSIFWRCALLSLVLGVFLGDLYVSLAAMALALPSVVRGNQPIEPLLQFIGPGFVPATTSGLPNGAAIGVIVGVVDALVLGVVAWLVLGSSPMIPRHRSIAYIASALVTVLIGGWRFYQVELPGDLAAPLTTYALLYGVPMLLFGLAQLWIVSRVVLPRFGHAAPPILSPVRTQLREITLVPVLILLAGIAAGGVLAIVPKSEASPVVSVASPLRRVAGLGEDVLRNATSLVWLRGSDAVVVSSWGVEAGRQQLHLIAIDGSGVRPVDFAGSPRCVSGEWRPSSALADGRLAFTQYCVEPRGTQFPTLDVRTGAVQLLYPAYTLPDNVTRISVADDLQLAVAWRWPGEGGGLWRLHPNGFALVETRLRCQGPPGLSPDGKTVAVVARVGSDASSCPHEGRWSLLLLDSASLEPRPLTRDFAATRPDYRTMPIWSPDGRWIAVRVTVPVERWFTKKSTEHELWLIEVASGRIYRPLSERLRVDELAWSSDGRQLAFLGYDDEAARRTGLFQGGLYVFDLASLVESPTD